MVLLVQAGTGITLPSSTELEISMTPRLYKPLVLVTTAGAEAQDSARIRGDGGAVACTYIWGQGWG